MTLALIVTLSATAALLGLITLADIVATRRHRAHRAGDRPVSVWQLQYDLAEQRSTERPPERR